MKNIMLLAGLLILNIQLLQAQVETMKWGKLSDEELKMEEYAADPIAEAVVLGDFGEINVNIQVEGIQYRFRRHRRVKIMKEEGLDRAKIRIPYYSLNNSEKITSLKAQIFAPDGRKTNLNKKDFIDEKMPEGQDARSFSFENVVPGSIIEYRYEIVSDRIIRLRDWFFQEDIPVRYSELKVEIPEWLEYIALVQGDIQLIKETQDHAFSLEIDNESSVLERDPRIRLLTTRYFLKDVPAIRPSAYVAAMKDYYSHIQFCLNKIYYPNGKSQVYMMSWDELAEKLKELPEFGQQYQNKEQYAALLSATQSLIARDAREEKQIEVLYNYLNKEVKWNGEYDIYSSSLDEAFKSREASSGALNLMLLALLRERGIDAQPLLVSTRSNGTTIQQYPFPEQFNHLLVKVQTKDRHSLLLDLSDPLRPINYPRTEALNSYGWLLNEYGSEWIAIEPLSGSDLMVATAELSEDGTLTGTLRNKYVGYNAVTERHQHQQEPKGNYWLDRLNAASPASKIKSYVATNTDKIDEPFQTEVEFSLSGLATVEGNQMSICPVLFTEYAVSQLQKENRLFPVDIDYPFKEQFVLKMKIPEGYKVESMPESTRILVRGGGGMFHYILNQKEGHLELISKIQLKQLKYQPEDYPDIKAYFDIIADKVKEKVVLRRQGSE